MDMCVCVCVLGACVCVWMCPCVLGCVRSPALPAVDLPGEDVRNAEMVESAVEEVERTEEEED